MLLYDGFKDRRQGAKTAARSRKRTAAQRSAADADADEDEEMRPAHAPGDTSDEAVVAKAVQVRAEGSEAKGCTC